ncbi:MAG: hypothetical protein ACTSYR_04165 [Candidatus Odinarchaeia archaeon]
MRVPSSDKIIKYISEINHIYPEEITLHYISKTVCPDCTFNPILKESTNILCPTCGGDGYIETDNPIIIECSVEGIDEEDVLLIPSGLVISDLIKITIDKKEIDQYNIDVTKVDYFTYNGDDYILSSFRKESLDKVVYEVNCILRKKENKDED